MPFISTTRDVPATRRSRLWRRIALACLLALWLGTAFWQANKSLPPGAHVDSAWYPVTARDVTFIADITSADAYGRPVVSQSIFDEVLAAVRSARKFIVLDYFLFNSELGATGTAQPLRHLSGELRAALIERRRAQPDLQILFITDPVNEVYGGVESRELGLLRAAGIPVVVTNLDRLRDSNFIYSSLWRLGIAWWSGGIPSGMGDPGPAGTGVAGASAVAAADGARADAAPDESTPGGWLPNPLGESADPISFAAWARLLNFKANHRKVLIADDGQGGLVSIVGSANPHDASSAHSNVALKIKGRSMLPLLQSELAVARFSGWTGHIEVPAADVGAVPSATDPTAGRARVLTEGAIRSALLERLDATVSGDAIDIAMFYVADRGVVEALLAASRRGVAVRLILDPNREAFGRPRDGIPNQPAASELVAASDGAIHVRWYRTHGEQFHTKMVMIYGGERFWVMLGSANLTRRNLTDYNLEADVAFEVGRDAAVAQQMLDYFDALWGNHASLGIEYTADFGYYADPSQLHYWLYRLMEGTGLSTF
ncbi:MAG TPA: phospholipase D-like domain-containing protein [Steroidobacteraceae bacterium]|nr:phospholipase D-like domain-containing protein [Steroidobacteraceae bacterium]